MAYSTSDDLKLELGEKKLAELTNEVIGGTTIDETKVTKAIKDADAEIDLFLNKRYDVPFSPVPDIVNSWSVDIAIYNVFPMPSEKIPEIRRINRDRAKSQIKKVAAGDFDIPGIDVEGMFSFGTVKTDHFEGTDRYDKTKDLLQN